MKATVKILGAAALGVAIAASAAGTAAAAPSGGLDDATGDVVRSLPLKQTTDDLPIGDDVARTGGQLLSGETKLPVANQPLSHTTTKPGPAAPSTGNDLGSKAGQLLGGLPLNPSTLTGSLAL